ncbi:hypothetical protein FE257_008826 [Aspergillus nanangensis]|uniref:C2H2-type domain-containing protein n=1 Tax=Aspergillus nanangensis TaxID=2582783 RepID=A0AAD4CME9_ASPNN|nr:hypothetical protein FE257_008826 [Aspergillus nanangensis]
MTAGRHRPQADHSRANRHRCSIAGCGKAFTRLSHLQRHSLNHSETQWVCNRCNAPFKRLDLLERHKARHTIKDSLAGGAGLGILQTRRKTISGVHMADDALSPSPSRLGSGIEESEPALRLGHPPPSSSSSSHFNAQPVGNNDDAPTGAGESIPQIAGPLLDAANMASMANIASPSVNLCELGNMYYDTSFDLVHFDVMGFTCSPPATSPGLSQIEGMGQYNGQQDMQRSSPFPYSPRSLNWAEIQSSRPAMTIEGPGNQSASGLQRSMNFTPLVNDATCLETLIQDVVLQTSDKEKAPDSHHHPRGDIALPIRKRDEIINLLAEIRPVTPEGSLVDGKTELLSLENMQDYLDLFFRYFNTSYPMVHVATLQIANTDPIFLLSMIILGQTYKNKESHQLSVCLYDALVPYILSGLMSIPIPDLSTLQAFLILECYGMYRAGPYQRENAMLIHTLLFSAIRRVSRYHVRGGIMLPNHLAHPDGGWKAFAYAEQYKRLILFVFMWDTQNVSCYSVMPNMSTHNIQVPLPCSQEIWGASTEAAWENVRKSHPEPPIFNDMVKYLVEDGDKLQCLPMDRLSLTLILHGLMSMCNDIAHFDNRSIYLNDMDQGEGSWTPWRRRMTHALETWKAKYDAYAMASFQTMGDGGTAGSNHQEESIALLALYHTAHIVMNLEIRHLQAAAGAKAIFGHIVMRADRQESAKWAENWIRTQTTVADHAAWHAAQMLREGLLNLKNWDVNGVFHYPWCLVIGTLTCWAFHHFGGETLDDRGTCSHPNGTDMQQTQSRVVMNHMVSLMASVSPTNIRRTLKKCCTHGLTIEVARYLKSVRWTAAFEAMKLLEGLSTTGS